MMNVTTVTTTSITNACKDIINLNFQIILK